jgi:hypothetical protein
MLARICVDLVLKGILEEPDLVVVVDLDLLVLPNAVQSQLTGPEHTELYF